MTDLTTPTVPDVVSEATAVPALLEARGVTMRFGGLVALDAVDFAVPRSSIVGLVGPNGAGKTTLFAVLSGLLRPSDGTVHLDGEDVTRSNPQHRAHLGLARTFQRHELFSELSVRDHLVIARRARHRPPLWRELLHGSRPTKEEAADVDEMLAGLDLRDEADLPAVSLPMGTGRLVEVARALATAPRVVLLDEPSSGLNDVETERLADVLRRAHVDHDVSMVVVEHNLSFVLGLSDVIHVLDFGKTIAVGTPEEVRNDERVQAAYIGTAAQEG